MLSLQNLYYRKHDVADDIHVALYVTPPSACNSDEFQCAASGSLDCINSAFVCDGENDCGDWSDEHYTSSK